MTFIQLRDSVTEDVYRLQGNLREADQLELDALGVDSAASLIHGLYRSNPGCTTACIDGKVAAMFGVVPGIDPEIGSVWLLGSDLIAQHKWEFLRLAPDQLKRISKDYEILANQVHEKNELHIRWLKWMGFRFLEHRAPFYIFARQGGVHV